MTGIPATGGSVAAPVERGAEATPGWRDRVEALVDAITAIRRADARCTSHPDAHGGPDRRQQAQRARNREAWPHVETVLTHGPHVVAGIRANVLVPDHLDPVAGPALRRLGTVEDALGRLRSVHTGWRDAAALLVGPEEKVRQVLLRVEDLRAAEAWPHAARFAAGPLPELAVFVTPRVGVVLPDREAQVRAATDRIGSAFGRASTVTASTAAAPPPGHRRSR